MLKGYSILLGEIVSAELIDHGDCADEQITCPHCYEPVFKVAGSHRAQGHLSHYRRNEAMEQTCELRVASLTSIEIADRNRITRGQTIEAYFDLFGMLMDRNEAQHVRDPLLVRRIRRHKEAKWAYEPIVSGIEEGRYRPEHLVEVASRKMSSTTTGSRLMDEYRRGVMPDVVKLLMATPRGPGMTRLLDASLCMFIEREQDDEEWRRTSALMLRAVGTSRSKALDIYRRMNETPSGPNTQRLYVSWQIMNYMASILAITDFHVLAPSIAKAMARRSR